ncbi:hypothetical protein EV401DRAFT_1856784 [Pisolithus croceorrhizus]|nr:hypothetical protein EV401DRAFT_1856784 [Pisolithus croceorrhizus]
MRLILSSEGVRNTTMTNEDGQVLYKTSTPFRFGARTTTLYKVVPNTDPDDMRDRLEAIGEIEWHAIGPSVMRLHGQAMMTDTFIPRHGIRGRSKRTFEGPDGLPYRWDMDFKFVRVCTCPKVCHDSPALTGFCTQLSRNDATRQELARFHRQRIGIIGSRRDPYLDVDLAVMHMLDMVVLTFIYVEKLRMDKERRAR